MNLKDYSMTKEIHDYFNWQINRKIIQAKCKIRSAMYQIHNRTNWIFDEWGEIKELNYLKDPNI